MTVGGRAGQPADRGEVSRPRVLVIEDEAAIARVVRGYLEREGFEVVVMADGETGVTAARESSPDVVVLDLMLPGIDGLEVCRRLRTFSDAYVIMLTARTEEIDRLVGLSSGATTSESRSPPQSWWHGSRPCSAGPGPARGRARRPGSSVTSPSTSAPGRCDAARSVWS